MRELADSKPLRAREEAEKKTGASVRGGQGRRLWLRGIRCLVCRFDHFSAPGNCCPVGVKGQVSSHPAFTERPEIQICV